MKQRQAVSAVTYERYRKARKKEKRQILDEFCATTGYSRGYARFVLKLRRQYKQLNPAALKRELDKLRKYLFVLATRKKAPIQFKTNRHKQKPLTIRPELIQ